MRHASRLAVCGLVVATFSTAMLFAQTSVDTEAVVTVDQTRGADRTVDYAALVHMGPWDDRNYELTRDDLLVLAANESTIWLPVPAFFRVALRRARPAFAGDSAARYPLYTVNLYRRMYGGYLVDGSLYSGVKRDALRYYVDLSTPRQSETASESISPETRVTSPVGGSESAIAINPIDSTKVVAGTVGPGNFQRMYYSTDGGGSWAESTLPFGGTCCDPSVNWSQDGQNAYALTLGNCGFLGCDVLFYRSNDDGVTWDGLETDTPGNPRRTLSINGDRPFLHVDRYPASPHLGNVYVAFHEQNVMMLSRSSDRGNLWLGTVFDDVPDERGIAGDVTTDRNGHVFYAWPAYESSTIRVRKSVDGGAVFGSTTIVANTQAAFDYPVPSQEAKQVSIYVTADTDLTAGPFADSVYLAWSDTNAPATSDPAVNHSQVRVAYSRDGGSSWTVTTPHETSDVLSVDRWQSALAVGSDGTVHVVFYDTRNWPDRSGVDVYYSYSQDGAQTWSAPRRVTSESSPNIDDCFEFGDYGGLDIVLDDLIAIFSDNRDETGAGQISVDVYSAGIVPGAAPSAGRIFGSRDFPGMPFTVVENPVEPDLDLNWDLSCGDGTDYAIYEGVLGDFASKTPLQCTTGGSTMATITPGSGDRFYVVVSQVSGAEGSYGRASSGAERTPDADPCAPQAIGACP